MSEILQALLLGLIQGLTEFIPISSSGHLILAEELFNFQVGGLLFDVMLHAGTLLALITYFRRDLLTIVRAVVNRQASRLAGLLIIGTLPAVIAGWMLQSLAEDALRSPALVAFNLAWVGLVMVGSAKMAGPKELDDLKAANSLVIGAAQALALVPGISRSGITILAGLGQGLKLTAAARFSFLLAIPVTTGAIAKLLLDTSAVALSARPTVFLTGMLTAAVSGYMAIRWLLNFLNQHGLKGFGYYRMALAVTILVVILIS